MKESEVFFVSKEYEKEIKAKDFYNSATNYEHVDTIKLIEFSKSEVTVTLSHFNYRLSRQYELSEIYINGSCFKFNKALQFNIRKYNRLKDDEQELVLFLDLEKFWKALEDEY